MDKTLATDDAVKILEELLPAQNKSHPLGLVLNLPYHEVEAIHMQYQNPQERLLRVIIEFLNQVEPRPTWEVIVEALRSRAVNLPALARRVEAAYCPDSITTNSGEFTAVFYRAITTPTTGPGPLATPSDLKSSQQLSSSELLTQYNSVLLWSGDHKKWSWPHTEHYVIVTFVTQGPHLFCN